MRFDCETADLFTASSGSPRFEKQPGTHIAQEASALFAPQALFGSRYPQPLTLLSPTVARSTRSFLAAATRLISADSHLISSCSQQMVPWLVEKLLALSAVFEVVQ